MAILTFFVANHDYFIFFSMFWLWRMCLKPILQNVNVPAATMAILTFFVNVLVMEMCLKSNFAKCECPGGYDGDPPNFMNKIWSLRFLSMILSPRCVWNHYFFFNVNILAAMMTILTIWWLFYISKIKVFTTQQLNLCRSDTRYGYSEFSKKFWNMPKQNIF